MIRRYWDNFWAEVDTSAGPPWGPPLLTTEPASVKEFLPFRPVAVAIGVNSVFPEIEVLTEAGHWQTVVVGQVGIFPAPILLPVVVRVKRALFAAMFGEIARAPLELYWFRELCELDRFAPAQVLADQSYVGALDNAVDVDQGHAHLVVPCAGKGTVKFWVDAIAATGGNLTASAYGGIISPTKLVKDYAFDASDLMPTGGTLADQGYTFNRDGSANQEETGIVAGNTVGLNMAAEGFDLAELIVSLGTASAGAVTIQARVVGAGI